MSRKILLTLTLLAVCYWFIFDFLRWIEFDTAGYIGAARLLFHLDEAVNIQSRISKPLVLILPGSAELLFGIHPKYIFLAQNLTCFYLCGFLIYKILFLLTKEEKLSYLGMCAYVLCQPFAVYSLFVQVDVAGWFFELAGIYLCLKWVFYSSKTETKKIALIAFICGVGCLVKESAIMAFMFLICCILLQNFKGKEKLKFLCIAAISFLVPMVTSQFVIDHYYNITIIKRVIEEQHAEGFVYYNKKNFQQVFRIMDMYWILFFIGIVNIGVFVKKHNCGLILKAMLITAVAELILIPVYPFIVDRILFMVSPFLIPLVICGADQLQKNKGLVVLIGGALNIIICFLIYKYQVHGLLFWGGLLYLLVIGVFHFYKNTLKHTSNQHFTK